MTESTTSRRAFFPAQASIEFPTPQLHVPPSVVGSSHSYQHQGSLVTITVPRADIAALVARAEEHMPSDDTSRIGVLSWNPETGTALSLSVSSVDVSYDLPNPIALDHKMLSQPPNARHLVAETDAHALDSLCTAANETLISAAARWLSVLRWKSKDATIGREGLQLKQTGFGAKLRVKPSLAQVWAGGIAVTLMFKEPLAAEEWDATGAALMAGLEAPVYWTTYLDGIVSLRRADLGNATILFAVACEVFLRRKLATSLPAPLSQPLRDYIDDMNIRPLITKAFPDLLSATGQVAYSNLTSGIHRLFDARNDIMHSGSSPHVDDTSVQSFRSSTLGLLDLEEDQTVWK